MKILRINKISSGDSRRVHALFQVLTSDYRIITVIAKSKQKAFKRATKILGGING